MEEIKEKLTNLSFPAPQTEEIVTEVVEQLEPEPEVVKPEETVVSTAEEIVTSDKTEPAVEVLFAQGPPAEEGAPVAEAVSAETEVVGEEQVPAAEDEVKEEAEKVVDFNEIFTLRPEILGIQPDAAEEDEEDLDKKKKKKKKKKFVEVVYDPDRDITLVKRKA